MSIAIDAGLVALGCAGAVYALQLWRRGGRGWSLATGLGALAGAIWTAVIVLRWIETRHWPLATAYEFALCFVWAIVVTYLMLEAASGVRAAGIVVFAIALSLAAYARYLIPAAQQTPRTLLPALQSTWFPIHAGTAAVGYGLAAVAAGAALGWLVGHWRGWSDSSEELDRLWRLALAWSFPWLSLAILSGAIWAQTAWGVWWNWDPKEVWALLAWLIYTLIFHLRIYRNWRGTRLAWLTLLGFGAVLFTFLGVGWLARTVGLESLHVF